MVMVFIQRRWVKFVSILGYWKLTYIDLLKFSECINTVKAPLICSFYEFKTAVNAALLISMKKKFDQFEYQFVKDWS